MKYAEGLGGQGTFDGSGDSDVYQASGIRGGGPGADDSRENYNPGGSGGNPDSSDSNTAPGYVASVQSQPAQTGKPKGKNITEGGFDDDPSNNASFNNEIGTENDPGRQAENDFQRNAQSASGATGAFQRPGEGSDNQYDALKEEQNL